MRPISITHNGETLTLAEWARRTGLTRSTIYMRIFIHNWPMERAFTEPARPRHCHSRKRF